MTRFFSISIAFYVSLALLAFAGWSKWHSIAGVFMMIGMATVSEAVVLLVVLASILWRKRWS